MSLKSMWGSSGGLSGSTKASVRGECGEDGWVPCGGEAPLSRWFLFRVASLLASYVGLSSSGWVKSSVGLFISLRSDSATLCICWSYSIWTSSPGVLAEPVGEFLGDPKKSELPSLYPELSSYVTLLSGSLDGIFKNNNTHLSDSQYLPPDDVCDL